MYLTRVQHVLLVDKGAACVGVCLLDESVWEKSHGYIKVSYSVRDVLLEDKRMACVSS